MNQKLYSKFICNKINTDYLIILAVLLLGMWQIVIGIGGMKWDLTDIYLPWKFFVTECLHNGNLPLWNPYSTTGFPQMSDPGTWYPISWIIGLVGRYSIYSVHFEFIFHLYIAAIGMYKIGELKKFSRSSKIIIAISYMFSGFFISNAQHLGWLVGASWFPFIYYYFSKITIKPDFNTALKLCLVLFLLLSGGYPPIFIVTAYFLICFYIVFIFKNISTRNYELIRKTSLYLLYSAGMFVLLSAVVIVASFDLSKYIARAGGLANDDSPMGILNAAFTQESLLTFLFPFSSTKGSYDFWKVDFSMTNIYIGVFVFLILLFYNFSKGCKKEIRINTALGLLFLIIALAKIFPLRTWLTILPYMDMFRLAAFFRFYTIFFFIIAAGYAIDDLLLDYKKAKRFGTFLLFAVFGLFIIAVISFNICDNLITKSIYINDWWFYIENASISERIFWQALLHIALILSFFVFYTLEPWHKLKKSHLFVLWICMDMILSVQLNTYSTIISPCDVKRNYEQFESFPYSNPTPSLTTSFDVVTDSKLHYSVEYLWKNIMTYHKIPSPDGCTPYKFSSVERANENGNYAALSKHPFLFFAHQFYSGNIVDTNTIDTVSYKRIKFCDFTNNQIHISTTSFSDEYLICLQNYHEYWEVYVDGEKKTILAINDTFIGVKLDKGIHDVVFKFNPSTIIILSYLSIVSCLIFGILCIIPLKKNKPLLILVSCVGFVILIFFILNNRTTKNIPSYKAINKTINNSLEQYHDSIKVILNVDNMSNIENSSLCISHIPHFTQSDSKKLVNALDTCSKPYLLYVETNKVHYELNEQIIKYYFPRIIKEYNGTNGYSLLVSKNKIDKKGPYFFNNFEIKNKYWDSSSKYIDSTFGYLSQHSFRVDSSIEYCCTFKINIMDLLTTQSKGIFISAKVYGSFNKESFFITQIYNSNKNIKWKSERFPKNENSSDSWSNFFAIIPISEDEIDERNTIDLYIWNKDRQNFYIDDIAIKQY